MEVNILVDGRVVPSYPLMYLNSINKVDANYKDFGNIYYLIFYSKIRAHNDGEIK